MERLYDKAACSFNVAFIVSVILMFLWPIGMLFNDMIVEFIKLLLLLSFVMGIYNLLFLLPITYIVELLVRNRRKKVFISIIAHGFLGFVIGFILVSLYNGKFVWNYFFNVPGILSGILYPIIEKWYFKDDEIAVV